MAIITKGQLVIEKRQFGVKISKKVLEKLEAYSKYGHKGKS
jgi:hypothetical protein